MSEISKNPPKLQDYPKPDPNDAAYARILVDGLLEEIDEVTGNANKAIKTIMLGAGRIGKYPSFNWASDDESEDSHLEKGMRHFLTYKLIRDGYQKPDGEDHLFLGICRISMALSIRERKKNDQSKTEIT